MAEERVQRRLAAILIADVVGYSRLMEADEEGTRARHRSLHAEVIDPNVAADGGRVVKTSGDGTLVEFPSAVDAVRNAVRTQAAIRRHNRDIPEDRRIVYRVGINVGDIIVEGDDIFGDGVNVASRLEGLCAPGEVYISGNVYDHVKDKLPVDFEDLGEQTVKNISNPVRMYRVYDANTGGKPAALVESVSLPPPDKPSIAVLPFDNLSNDPEQEYFSDGLVEDLITDISKISGLFVIARNSSFAFKGQAVDVKEIADKLGVKHVVEGSVRKMGSRLRISAQLIDAANGGHIWAERYDGDLENIFEFQDDIRDQIVAALQVSLTPAEQTEAQRHLTDSVEAYELFLRARTEFFKFTSDSIAESVRLYEQAIEVDPNFAAAYANLSIVLQTSWSFILPGCENALEQALERAQKAVEIDPQLGLAHTRLGWVQCFMRQHDASIASFERALEMSPNDAEAYAYLSHVYNYLGEPERAIELVKTAFRFDPMLPPNVAFHWGEACFQAKQYDEAIEKLHECLDKAPDFFNGRLILAAALSEMGRKEEAADELAIVRSQLPDENIRKMIRQLPYRSEDAHARLIDGVQRAGMLE
jgi:adenylate cyclase